MYHSIKLMYTCLLHLWFYLLIMYIITEIYVICLGAARVGNKWPWADVAMGGETECVRNAAKVPNHVAQALVG